MFIYPYISRNRVKPHLPSLVCGWVILHHSMFLLWLGKHVKLLVPAVISRVSQKPENLSTCVSRGIVLPSYWVVEVRDWKPTPT